MTTERSATAYRGSDRRLAGGPGSHQYRGPDRRGSRAPANLRYIVLAIALVLLAVVAVRATLLGGAGRVVTFAALRDSSAGLFVLSGTLLLVVWGLTGRAARAVDGSAMLLAGGGMLILAGPWGVLLQHTQTATLISPACRVALGVPAILLLLRSPGVVPIVSSVRPLRVVTNAAAGSLGLLGVEAVARLSSPLNVPTLWIVAMAALSAGWIAAGMRRLRRRDASISWPGERTLGLSLVAFGVGDVFLTVGLHTGLTWAVVGAAVQLVGAAGATSVAMSWLLRVLRRDGSRRLRLASELADVSTVLAGEQSERHQLVHDARNVMAAIRIATATLERHGDRLDPVVQEQLRVAAGSEFDRLQRLLDQPRDVSGVRS